MKKMVTQRVYRGSDLIIDLTLKDKNGNWYRVADIYGFDIKFYTTDKAVFIECSKEDETYSGIVSSTDTDEAVINSSDLDKLSDGLIHYIYHIKIANTSFNDGYYDEYVTGETPFYLKTETC